MDLLFTTPAIKRFIYLILITIIALTFFTHIESTSSNWLVWSILLAATITAGITWQRRLSIIAAAAIIIPLCVLISGNLSSYLLPLCLYLFIVTLACTYFSNCNTENSYPIFLLNLFTILACGFAPTELENLERSIFVFLGFGIGLIVQIIWWPISAKDNLCQYLQIALQNLKDLNQDIFACFLQVEYSDNVYLFERRIHEGKNKFIQSLGLARKFYASKASKMSRERSNDIQETLKRTDKLFDILLDCAQLRRRVTDHTTFLLCVEELKAIVVAIDKALSDIMHKLRNDNYQFESLSLDLAIIKLEDSYQNILRVTAREPLVFLLFIFSLKAINNEIESWQKELQA